MEYSRRIVEKVVDEFAKKRQNAVNAADARQQEMYITCPQLKEIDKALSLTGMKIFASTFQGKEGLEKRMKALEKESRDLLDDKKRILKLMGKPENYLDIKYSCEKCGDTGYVGIKMCTCMKKALAKCAYDTSGLGSSLSKQGFDNFDLNYYSDEKNKDGISPRDNMAYVLSEAKDYVKNFGKLKDGAQNLLFVGGTGLGKTHISTAIAKGVLDKGCDVVYDTMQNIMHTYEKSTFAKDEAAALETTKYIDATLLIIDDLGTELKSVFSQNVLYNILNTRIISEKATIINTNLNGAKAFKEQYDDRINSRLIGNFRTFNFYGEDIRLKKARENNAKKRR